MTSIFPKCPFSRPEVVIGPGLNVIERRPCNSNQDMDERKHMVDYVGRDVFAGIGKTEATERAVLAFKYPSHTRLETN